MSDSTIRLFVLTENCQEPGRKFNFVTSPEALYKVAPGSTLDKAEKLVEVFSKPAGQPVAEAIREQFIDKLPPAEKQGCVVVSPASRIKLTDASKEAYEIAPSGPYAETVKEQSAKDPSFRPCGAYGRTDAISFFAYHPRDSRVRFLFVRMGTDPPPFDEQSLRLR